jgi:hypothetical protein
MKLLKVLLAIVAGLAVVVLGGALLIPPDFAVSRSVRVNAPAERIFARFDTAQGWSTWGVWYRRDPQMKVTENGAARGVGAAWSWVSENQGNGAMRLTEVQPGLRVAYELTIEGFDPSHGDLTLTPDGDATRVTWRMHGTMGYGVGRWFGLFMDRLVGPDLEAGLANLKALAEQPA